MANMGLAILSGLLQGMGGIGKNVTDRREQEAERALKEKQHADTLRVTERGQQVEVPPEFIPEPFRARFPADPVTGLVRLDKGLAGFYDKMNTRSEEQARYDEMSNAVLEAGTTPALSGDPDTPPAVNPRARLAAALVRRHGPGAAQLTQALFPEEKLQGFPTEHNVWATTPGGTPRLLPTPKAEPLGVPEGTRPVVTQKPSGGEVRYEYAPPPSAHMLLDDLMLQYQQARTEWGEQNPQTLALKERADAIKSWTIQPGGARIGATGTSTPGPPIRNAPGEREDLALLDSAEWSLQKVVDALKEPGGVGDIMGGVLKNPKGAIARETERYLGHGMTDAQRRMMGVLAIQLQNAKHILIGATRTRPELADIANAIPDEKSFLSGDSASQMSAKLGALILDLQSKRSARENVMRGSGVVVPESPRSSPPPTTTPPRLSGPDSVRRAQEMAIKDHGQPFGNLTLSEQKAIFERVKRGE